MTEQRPDIPNPESIADVITETIGMEALIERLSMQEMASLMLAGKAAWEAGYRAGLEQPTAKGWRMVPDEPTRTMIHAGRVSLNITRFEDRAQAVYRAMINTSSAP